MLTLLTQGMVLQGLIRGGVNAHLANPVYGAAAQGLIRGGVNAHLANPGYGAAGPH